MNALEAKVEKLLQRLKTLENVSSEEREKAVKMLAESIEGKKLYLVKKNRKNPNLVAELRAARARLEDIHTRLELSIKSGNANSTIH